MGVIHSRLDLRDIEWIGLTRLPNLEVQQAVKCVREKSNYENVNPYVSNILATIVGAPGIAAHERVRFEGVGRAGHC